MLKDPTVLEGHKLGLGADIVEGQVAGLRVVGPDQVETEIKICQRVRDRVFEVLYEPVNQSCVAVCRFDVDGGSELSACIGVILEFESYVRTSAVLCSGLGCEARRYGSPDAIVWNCHCKDLNVNRCFDVIASDWAAFVRMSGKSKIERQSRSFLTINIPA